jgi:hypothetical protein
MIPSVNIDTLHTNILAELQAQFPDATVALYPRPGEKIETPGILLELEDLPADDPDEIGTEQLGVMLMFNAYVVLDYKAGKKQAVKTMAAAVMAFIRGRRWDCPVGAANVAGGFPDVIGGRENDYEVMRVEFSHEAMLGIDVWTADQLLDDEGDPLPPPSEVYVSDTPGVANSHEEITNCGCDAE